MVKLSGGGITSNKLVQSKSPKVEPKSHAVSPERAAQIGLSTHFTKDAFYSGKGYSNPVGPSSNMDARPGGNGRQIFKAGSQSATPQARPMPAGRGFDQRPNRK